MDEAPRKYASPACALSAFSAMEADPAYMGWLEPLAVDAALADLLRLAPDDTARQALLRLRPGLPASPRAASAPDKAAFKAALAHLLPRIRDDALHAALKRLAG